MGKVLSGIFGGKPKTTGPSAEAIAAQEKQKSDLAAQEASAAKEKSSARAVIAARTKGGGGVTLNPVTGARGVVGGGKLGGV